MIRNLERKGFEVHVDKTKKMVLRKTGRRKKERVRKWEHREIEGTNEFRYFEIFREDGRGIEWVKEVQEARKRIVQVQLLLYDW